MRLHPGFLDASEERASARGATLRRLLGEFGPYTRRLAVALALTVVGAATQAVGPWLISVAIDRDIAAGDRLALARTMLLLLGAYVVGTLAQRAQMGQIGTVGQHVLADLRERLFARLQRLPLGFYARRPIGDLMSRVTSDVDTLNQLLSQGLVQIVGSLVGLVGILVAMLALSVPLALVSFTAIPAMVLTTRLFARRAKTAYRTTRETTGDVAAGLQEEIVGIREAQAFGRTETNIARFRERNRANLEANVQAVGITSAFAPTMDVLSTIATAVVVGVGGALVLQGQATVGLVAAFLIYVQQFFRPIQLVSQMYTQVQASLAGAERIYAILDEATEPEDAPGAVALARVAGRIEFDRVSFAYAAGRPVLRDVSFVAEPGQTVALVGRTGAGKTTVASLIPRFYDVAAGAVRVDGHDVREVTSASLRAQMALVPQEPFLFGGTIAENIRYGRLDATTAEVQAAARVAGAHAFIMALPLGYDTPVGEGGGMLSRGQRQLLAFARAVLANPRILILDEATSSVDTRTEAAIQAALRVLLKGRTSVVIAHRLSTIEHADLILVMEDGQVVERGRHADLLAAGGTYAALHRRQFRDPPALAPQPAPAVPAGR